nr:dnaJ homolog subfamily B member 4-like [Arachis hypogaea]
MQRFEIVNGVTEVEGIAEEKTVGAEEDEEKGVPAFWLNSMKNYEVLAEEIEILKIEVKPGWRKGTKIKFEGKGDEKPGYLPADIVFIIEEKKHNLFRREGNNDLEICIEIPLVDAFTGCSLPIPILGGEKLTLSFENTVVY